jgi:hypothetical protein
VDGGGGNHENTIICIVYYISITEYIEVCVVNIVQAHNEIYYRT